MSSSWLSELDLESRRYDDVVVNLEPIAKKRKFFRHLVASLLAQRGSCVARILKVNQRLNGNGVIAGAGQTNTRLDDDYFCLGQLH